MTLKCNVEPLIGVGLRHKHYQDALASPAPIDFVEVHSENFFASGGATINYLKAVRDTYQVSLHSTALGLGSAKGVPGHFINKLKNLISLIDPILVSDHASYAWSTWMSKPIHMGDLLPLSFNEKSLQVLVNNVEMVQNELQRQILVENLSSYLVFKEDEMSEAEFLTQLHLQTGCGLLVDLNNILVSAANINSRDKWQFAYQWLNNIPSSAIKEIHLAGHTPVAAGEIIIDDHSQPISEDCWQLYRLALKRFGAVPTLIEWDNNLPSWPELIAQVTKAKLIAKATLTNSATEASYG